MKVSRKMKKVVACVMIAIAVVSCFSCFLAGYLPLYTDANASESQMDCTVRLNIHNTSPFIKSVDLTAFLIPNSTFCIDGRPQQEAIIGDAASDGYEVGVDGNDNYVINASVTLPPMSVVQYFFDYRLVLRQGNMGVPDHCSYAEYNKSSPEFAAYTSSEEYIESDDSAIVAYAALLNDSNPWVVVENVISFIAAHMTYSHGSNIGAAWAMDSGIGVCFDYACLMTALLRACGIPARYADGLVIPDAVPSTTIVELYTGRNIRSANSSRHAWVEYYLPKVGWIVSDPTWYDGNDGNDPSYLHGLDVIHLTTFRGSPLTPPISGIRDTTIAIELVYEFSAMVGTDHYSRSLALYTREWLVVVLLLSIFGMVMGLIKLGRGLFYPERKMANLVKRSIP
jgi:transglutaminase-like putative cysteine protease